MLFSKVCSTDKNQINLMTNLLAVKYVPKYLTYTGAIHTLLAQIL